MAKDPMKKPSAKRAMLSVRVPADVKVRLKVAAAERGVSIETAVAEALARWLDAAPRRKRGAR